MLNKSNNNFLFKLRNLAIIVTILNFIISAFGFSKRYDKLEIEYESNIRQELYDSLFCCDWPGDEENRISEEISAKWRDFEVPEKTIDNWIRYDLSKMGRMDKSQYNYYFKTTDRALVKEKYIDYKIKSEQKIELEKYRQNYDSISDSRLDYIDIESAKRTKDADIMGLLPLSYLIGAFFGFSFLPLVFWSTWFYFKKKSFK